MRAAAEEREEHRRAERAGADVAGKFRAAAERRQIAEEARPRARRRVERGGFRQRDGGPDHHHGAGDGGEQEHRLPAEPGVEQAADQRAEGRHHHHHGGDQPDHRGGAVPVEQVADDGAADHDAGRGAERLQHPRHDQAADGADHDGQHARRGGQLSAASTTRRRPNRSDSGPITSCPPASASR